ncbi:MAG TPA: ABC transporter ATP-binding protein [Mesorhizobium sp.]
MSASGQEVLVSIRDLSVSYSSEADNEAALKGISLDIRDGERLAIIGESGSGKSTFALAIAGLLPGAAKMTGSIEWPGFSTKLGQKPLGGRDIGFVFQDPSASLDPVMPIGRQIAEVAKTHLFMSWPQAYGHAEKLLKRVRLDPASIIPAYPHQLSGGQKQRAAIAAAIAAGPNLLIADEATSALDTIVQAEVVSLIEQLVNEDGMALLFVTHDIALAARLAERIAVFQRGEMVELGETANIIHSPRHACTRTFRDAHIGLDTAPLLGRPAGGPRHG